MREQSSFSQAPIWVRFLVVFTSIIIAGLVAGFYRDRIVRVVIAGVVTTVVFMILRWLMSLHRWQKT